MARGVSASPGRRRVATLVGRAYGTGWAMLIAACSSAAQPIGPPPQTLAQQRDQYAADAPKTILELQPFRTQSRAVIRRSDGTEGGAILTNLNPYVGAWYLLTLNWPGNASPENYHLETARQQALSLRDGDPSAVRIADDERFPL